MTNQAFAAPLPDPKDDALHGVDEIAEFINESKRRTQYLLATRQIPGGHFGRRWVASRSLLREHYAAVTSGKSA